MYYHIPIPNDWPSEAYQGKDKKDFITSLQIAIIDDKINSLQSELASHLFYGLL